MRRSGKSFRKLLEAIRLASDGKYVLFAVDTTYEVQRLKQAALDIINSYTTPGFCATRISPAKIILGDAGSITFTVYNPRNKKSINDALRGLPHMK